MSLINVLAEQAQLNELALLTELIEPEPAIATVSGWDPATAQPIVSVDGAREVVSPAQRSGIGLGAPAQVSGGYADWSP